MDRELTYQAVTFRKSGNSRFIVSVSIISGWNRIHEVPKLLDVSSVSLLDPLSPVKLTMKAFRDYNALLEPSMPAEVEIITTNSTYDGLLVKKTSTTVSLVTNTGLIEISAPYVLSYIGCPQNSCKSIIPRVSLYFENLNLTDNHRVDVTFEAGGFSWSANYKAIFDFERQVLLNFSGEILCRNDTDLLLEDIEASFMSKSDENEYPHLMMAMAVQRSASYASSEQTAAGSAIYRLPNRVRIPEKSLASFKFIEFGGFNVKIKSLFNILQRPLHPMTIVKFDLPNEFTDGIPAGSVEIWNGTTWLADSQLPMTAPGQSITLNLGENAFVILKVDVSVNNFEDSANSDQRVARSLYKVSVAIENRSQYMIYIVPYHPIDREVKDLQTTPSLLITEFTPSDGSTKQIQFGVPAMKPNSSFAFQYTMTA
jgi:hypothetical protein